MAKHKYISSGGLFDDDDSDIEDDGSQFRSRIPRPIPKETGKSDFSEAECQKQVTLQKIQDIEQRTLASAERSINMLLETHQIGVNAAVELVDQGQKLQNASNKLDEIDSNLKESQKHLNGIKSVFYGLKNYISKKSRSPSPCRRNIPSEKQSPKFGKSTFYDITDSSAKSMKYGNGSSASSLQSMDLQSSTGASSKQVDDILEANLQEMAYHLSQLKGLGVEIGKEIDNQDELLDVLNEKVDRASIKIDKQNKEMNNLLGK